MVEQHFFDSSTCVVHRRIHVYIWPSTSRPSIGELWIDQPCGECSVKPRIPSKRWIRLIYGGQLSYARGLHSWLA